MTGNTPLIELKGITRSFGQGDLAVPVLKGIDLKIYPGEFVAIMGPSGSGKSTLMNILGCLDQPSSGEYWFDGRDVSALSRDELALLRREAFGFVFQSYNLLPGMTARENVEIPAIYAGMAPVRRHQRADELLTGLGLGERLTHRPSELSGGQQQRVSIARALMNGGQIIFADEPTGALDSKSSQEVIRLLTDLSAQGHTVILITHDQDVADVARRQIHIADGEVVRDTGVETTTRTAPVKAADIRNGAVLSDWQEALKSALRSLRSNLFRTALTLLGIVIGVASVITMLAIGEGAKKDVADRISTMGSDLLLVRPGGPDQRGGRWSVTTLVADDYRAINEDPHGHRCPGLEHPATVSDASLAGVSHWRADRRGAGHCRYPADQLIRYAGAYDGSAHGAGFQLCLRHRPDFRFSAGQKGCAARPCSCAGFGVMP